MNVQPHWNWRANPAALGNSFDAKAPEIDHGAGRVDPARYHDPHFMELEWDRMWTRVWLLAGPVSDLREPGDFFRFDVGRESFVIVRGDDDKIHAHYNVCPHRGARLVQSDVGSLGQFTCPFHSWQFDLDGCNRKITDRETFRPEVLCHGTDLSSVSCEVIAGLVFITMNPEPPPLRDWLGVVAEHLEIYEIEKMNVVQHKRSEWASNWKTAVDAFYEIYHLHAVHPQTQGVMDDIAQLDLYPNGMSRMYIPFARTSFRVEDKVTVNPGIQMMLKDAGIDPAGFSGTAGEARGAIQKAKRERAAALGLDYSRFTDGQLSDSVPYGVFPNVQMGCHPEAIFLMRFLPHPDIPGRFYYDNIILYRHVEDPDHRAPDWMGLPEGLDMTGELRPDIQHIPLGVSPDLGLVLDQDSELLPTVQQGLRSRGFRGPLWSDQESRVRHFHAELSRYVAGEK